MRWGRAKSGVDAAFILKSEDGGESWAVVSVIEGESGTEGGLFFIDEQTGYLSTHYAKSSLRTTDGGVTWTGMTTTGIGRQIIFADPEVGWAMQYNKLSYTTDGGRRWASRTLAFPAEPNAFSFPRRDVAYAVGNHGMIYRYRVVPDATPAPAHALAAPAMPSLDNAVLAQISTLETRLDKIESVVEGEEAAGSGGRAQTAQAREGWSDPALQQQIAQLQGTVDAVSTGVPQLGRKHRNLNMAMFGLQLLGDLTGQGSSLKDSFTGLRQAKSAADASAALTSLHAQLDGMKSSVDVFRAAKTRCEVRRHEQARHPLDCGTRPRGGGRSGRRQEERRHRRPAKPPVTVTVTAAETATTATAIRGRPSTSRLESIGRNARQMKQQVQTLRTNIAQSGWNDALRANGAGPINGAVDELTREVDALLAKNSSATFDTGRRLAMDLQTQLAQLGAAEQALAGARDATVATAALTQMSASLDKVILTIDTLPPCCTERTCCYVGIQ